MIYEVINENDARLVAPNEKVTDVSTVKELIADLRESLTAKNPKGLGLAAPQIGVNKKVLVMRVSLDSSVTPMELKPLEVLINPEIVKTSSEMLITREGCLSVPDKICEVIRFKTVKVKALDENGRQMKRTYQGREAIVVQHEIDHLNQIVMTMKARNIIDTAKQEPQINNDLTNQESGTIVEYIEESSTLSEETIAQIAESFAESVQEAAAKIAETVDNVVENIEETVEEVFEKVEETVDNTIDAIGDFVSGETDSEE